MDKLKICGTDFEIILKKGCLNYEKTYYSPSCGILYIDGTIGSADTDLWLLS